MTGAGIHVADAARCTWAIKQKELILAWRPASEVPVRSAAWHQHLLTPLQDKAAGDPDASGEEKYFYEIDKKFYLFSEIYFDPISKKI